MKIPLILDGDDPGAIVSFEAEQMIMPRLSGPHVPRFHAAGDFAHVPHIVMEHIDGEPLTGVADRAPLPWEEVADLGARMATAVHALHRQGVNHLDLKPGNMLARPNGEIVLIDFGLSRHADLPDLLARSLPAHRHGHLHRARCGAGLPLRHARQGSLSLGVILYTAGDRPLSRRKGGSARVRAERGGARPDPAAKAGDPPCPVAQEIILCAACRWSRTGGTRRRRSSPMTCAIRTW